MSELPFLFFRPPTVTARKGLGGRGGAFRRPTPAQQRTRLQNRFEVIAQSFQGLQANISGFEPEQVIVLETLTEAVQEVAKAAGKVPGLEWLSERDLDDVDPEFGFEYAQTPGEKLPRRLYALMSTQRGMDQLLALWREWVEDPAGRAKRGFGPFKHVFQLLRDIRRWSSQDRIEQTGVLERWREAIEIGATTIFEIEFWFRSGELNRRLAYADIENQVNELGGRVLDQAVIPEILYHSVLVELRGEVVQGFLEQIQAGEYPPLLRSQGVMFFRARGQSAFGLRPLEANEFDLAERLAGAEASAGDPVLAVFDGLPLENHEALAERIIIDDADNHAASYRPLQQQHGTAMASLVIHGDLHDRGPALRRPLYIRPIFLPDDFQGTSEVTPPGRLLVDLIHRAVRRLFDGDGEMPAVAPSIRIISLALGDPDQPFDREMSPLARLLDWLSWKYKVLIIVSIGNMTLPITLGENWGQYSDEALIAAVLRDMQRGQYQRRALAPAEAINCVSVGAVHADSCPPYDPGPRVDVLRGRRLPSPLNTVANGFRRSTKPEILMPGGRLLFRQDPSAATQVQPVDSSSRPGVLTATPGIGPLELNRVRYSCGTSNATALASRCAALAFERISEATLPGECPPLDDEYYAVLLKVLLVHGASWGEAAEAVEKAFPEYATDWRRLARLKQRFLGFGEVDVNRCVSASEQRVTLLGYSRISDGIGHQFQMPLPPSLASRTELRRVTATLAWLSPTNHRHRKYRRAQLWIDISNGDIGTETCGLDALSARRGTVEHRIFEGSDAVPFLDGDVLRVMVSCREDAGDLDEPVAYALALTLEVGTDVAIDIYQEVSARIRPAVQVENVS